MNALRWILCLSLTLTAAHARSEEQPGQPTESELNRMINEMDPMGRIDAWPKEQRHLGTIFTCIVLASGYATVPLESGHERLDSAMSQVLKVNAVAKAVMARYSPEIPPEWEKKLALFDSTLEPFRKKAPAAGEPEISNDELRSALNTLSGLIK
jgi:hypothetical protein